MNQIRIFIIYFLLSLLSLRATGAWMVNQRTHGEIKWKTLRTENFDIHYYDKIEKIALRGASIAEQIRPTLMKQMGLDNLDRLSIAFTEEDEILNGFAVPANYTIIWIDQNDAALWSGDEKWLRTVLAHELQHLVFFNTIKGPRWLPKPMGILSSNIPGWVSEGLAEYYTEKWRPFRFDISHKRHVLRNTVHKIKDPHNDGFSKSLYLADRFGDTTITKILNYRNKLGFLNFESSFKKHTGIKLKQFNEDWRIQMNTYYYGKRSQKEMITDVGEKKKFPIKGIKSFDYFSDTTRLALIGKMSKGQRDFSLVIAKRDTAKENKIYKKRIQKEEKNKKEKAKRPEKKWILKEVDSGIFGELIFNLDVSPDDYLIIYPKYHYGNKQSLMFDIWKYDINLKKSFLLTSSMRANYPKFSPDGNQILFVSHKNSTTQLFTMKTDGTNIKQITNNKGDVQIITPSWSPNGNSISFAMSNLNGWMDIYILNLTTGITKQITNSIESDYNPIWIQDGNKISFTGLYDQTPNLFTYDFKNGEIIQNTDVGDIVIGTQWNKKNQTITAMTLNTIDDSMVIEIKPDRRAQKTKVIMNEKYSSWINKKPDHIIKKIDFDQPIKIVSQSKYSFKKNMRHLGTIIFPDYSSLLYNSAYTDVLGRHTFSTLFWTDYDKNSSLFIQYQNSTGSPLIGFWGLDFYRNANFQFQLYGENDESILEFFNGFSFWGRIPYNFGKSLFANHSINYSFQFIERGIEVMPIQSPTSLFSAPESGKESSVNLGYTLVKKRSHSRNLLNPNQGYGISFSIKETLKPIFGEFDYRQFKFDFYLNQKVGFFSIYSRHRFESMSGNPPNQEQLGIVNIPNYYIMGSTTPGREYMSPRGFSGPSKLGTKAYLGTFEFRAPVLPINILQAFRIINIGNPTFALISDFGDAWTNKRDSKKLVVQVGAEFRMSISLTSIPVFTFSYGWAQSPRKWNKELVPDPYFQLTVINPF